MKIYVVLAKASDLSQTSGDKINELAIYSAMSKFADVYYNNQKINFDEPNFGIDRYRPVERPTRKYDFHYVRAAPGIFLKINGPKAWMASPYNQKCYEAADAVVTFTDSWKKLLEKEGPLVVAGLTSGDIHRPKKVITFEQVVPDFFVPRQGNARTEAFRKKFKADFVVGNFGRMSKGTYPHSLLIAVERLRCHFPDKKIEIVHAGNVQKNIKHKVGSAFRSVGSFKYENMPYAISACDVVTCNSRQQAANWAGCKDVLEGMACGVPVLTGNYDVRKEQFGCDHKLFWPQTIPNSGRISEEAEDAMFEHLKCLASAKFGDTNKLKWRNDIVTDQLKRVQYYRADCVAKRMKLDIESVINGCGKKV